MAAPKRSKPEKRPPREGAGKLQGPVLADYCRALPGTTEDIKWGKDRIFSIGGKMYAGFDEDPSDQLSFKCAPDDFDRLTELPGIIPAPYAARFFWITVQRRGALPLGELKRLIRQSYDLVRAKLPARVQRDLPGA